MGSTDTWVRRSKGQKEKKGEDVKEIDMHTCRHTDTHMHRYPHRQSTRTSRYLLKDSRKSEQPLGAP
jgi:hypothetical protein